MDRKIHFARILDCPRFHPQEMNSKNLYPSAIATSVLAGAFLSGVLAGKGAISARTRSHRKLAISRCHGIGHFRFWGAGLSNPCRLFGETAVARSSEISLSRDLRNLRHPATHCVSYGVRPLPKACPERRCQFKESRRVRPDPTCQKRCPSNAVDFRSGNRIARTVVRMEAGQ